MITFEKQVGKSQLIVAFAAKKGSTMDDLNIMRADVAKIQGVPLEAIVIRYRRQKL